MREITRKVYSFSELSNNSREKARNFVIEHMGGQCFEYDVEYAKEWLEFIGFEDVAFHYSISFSQRDFVSFSAEKYRYKKLAVSALKNCCTQDEYTQLVSKLAKKLQSIQRKAFYKDVFKVVTRHNGRVMIDSYFYNYVTQEDYYVEALKDFNKCLYRIMSDNYLKNISDENIPRYADGYGLEFYADGSIYEGV